MKKIVFLAMAIFLLATPSVEALVVQKGDILLFGGPAVGQDDPGYTNQSNLALVQAMARDSGIYSHFWGILYTFDDTDFPKEEKYYWGHTELATEDGFEPACLEGLEEKEIRQVMVILRPTKKLKTVIDMEACLRGYQDLLRLYTGYSQPIFGIYLKWLLWGKENINWFEQPDLFWKWDQLWNVNLDELATPEFMQYSPHQGTEFYSDIASMEFMERDVDCSSVVAWALIRGWYEKFPVEVRKLFLNNIAAIAAVDTIAPGGLGWWLYENGFVDIIIFPTHGDFGKKITVNFLMNRSNRFAQMRKKMMSE